MGDQRKTKRYELRLPVQVLRAGAQRTASSGETRNLSSRGVLFTFGAKLNPGDPIEYIITLPTGMGHDSTVSLHCVGKVLRLENAAEPHGPQDPGRRFAVAVTLERYEFVRSL